VTTAQEDQAYRETEPGFELAPDLKTPVLDLDAMLKDLHNEFQGDVDDTGGTEPSGEGDSSGSGDASGVEGTGTPGGDDDGVEGSGVPDVGDLLPPGYVRVGEEVLPEVEVRAFLELNRRLKAEPQTATRVREALEGRQQAAQATGTQAQAQPDPDALPVWLDPDDQQAVFLYRQQQRIDRENQELREEQARRNAEDQQRIESQRVTEVRDAFRVSMKEFRDEFPMFDLEDLNKIANRAANMGLLEHPEKVGGTLKGGIVTALETAMWSDPSYRDKATSGDTVRDKKQVSATRKQKSSALSSSTGSVVRTQSQEQIPTTRKEVMAAGLAAIRSGQISD
jgi:hypothetical protein